MEMLLSGLLCWALLVLTSAITCPDGSTCGDGSACCLTTSGRYGCCPLARALPMLRAVSGNGGDDAVCPDGSQCPSEYSCLKSHNMYNCCPYAQGASCPDGKHCCPVHHRCAEDGRSCIKEKELIGAVICPDGELECPNGATCCQLPDSTWGCCPMAKAVCCEDGEHCCPEGSKCDVLHSKCLSPSLGDTPMWAKFPARKRAAWEDRTAVLGLSDNTEVKDLPTTGKTSVICPDGEQCPDLTTCCQLLNGSYGCCPFSNAVCCSDHQHCCPSGTTCDLVHSTCASASSQTPLVKMIPASSDAVQGLRDNTEVKDLPTTGKTSVICPDGKACPDLTTCCQLLNGSYGCCPYSNAVCCSDHQHCCPSGTTCDLVHSTCASASSQTPLVKMIPASSDAVQGLRDNTEVKDQPTTDKTSVICPDGKACPDLSTCCQLLNGSYGCCPYSNAVCCSDHQHCCPSGTTCDLVHSTCASASSQTPLVKMIPASSDAVQGLSDNTEVKDQPTTDKMSIICPDGKACPDLSTCCQLHNGSYGCCPFSNAVCCEDHIHCCPEGTECDMARYACVSPRGNSNWFTNLPALKSPSLEQKGFVPWLEKVPALTRHPNKAGNVTCDSAHACPDGTTCCKKEGGDWACCPLPEAVCCDDHIHCCPKDTICNLAASTCDDPSGSVPWLEKVPALTRHPNKAGNVTCDSAHACPDGTTCCKKEGGDWACCPLPQAVCCDDHIHCCPKGTICNLAASTCDDPSGFVPWLEKVPALTRHPNKAGNVTCDSAHACPDGTTCCKKEGGDWACCPLPEAVCCDDHIHCCPKGTICNLAASTCDDPSGSVPWLEKVPALPQMDRGAKLRAPQLNRVYCDATTSCPDDNTCCFMKSIGSWGCCPLPNAVCCVDGDHCCPEGYTCNRQGRCTKRRMTIPWYARTEASTSTIVPRGVQCDPKSSCAAGSTCCPLPMGQWGCCPLDKAVCCRDLKHCCPHGYTCDPTTGSCSKSGQLRWDTWPIVSRKRKPLSRL